MVTRVLKIAIALAVCAVLVFLTGCTAGSVAVAPNTQVVTIKRGNLTEDIVASGNLALAHIEDLSFQITGFTAVTNPGRTGTTMIAGYVSDVLVEKGDSVKKGQALAKLDAAEWSDHIIQLENTVISAGRQVSAKERALAQAKLDLETAQYNLYLIEDVKQAKSSAARLPLQKASDDLADAQNRLKFAETNLQAAQVAGDVAAANIIREQIKFFTKDITEKQKTLADALSGHSTVLKSDVNSKVRQINTQIELAKAKVLDAQIAIDDARRVLEEAQKSLDDAMNAQTAIVAPFDGFITKVNVAGGDQVSRGTVAVQLAAADSFEAEIQVSEKDIRSVKVGGRARVEVDSLAGLGLPATIVSIAPTATLQLGVVNYKVKIQLDSNKPTQPAQSALSQAVRSIPVSSVGPQPAQLKQGMSITVYIVIGERNNAVLAPNRAIIRQGKDTLVRVMKDGAVSPRPIKVGINDWQYTEVIDGLNDGEQVIIQQLSAATK